MVGLQALSVAVARGAVPHRPVLFRLGGHNPLLPALYDLAADLCEIRVLPRDDAEPHRRFPPAAAFRRTIDLRDFAFDPAFRRVPMIDFFLDRLGIGPAEVQAAERRNTWLAPRVRPSRPDLDPAYVLLCPRASMALRDMPGPAQARLLTALCHRFPHVVTQGFPSGTARQAPRAESIAELCGLVAAARLIVSVDTAMVHLADAFAVPTVAVFTTHEPTRRVRDYPLCQAVQLETGLPPALEFSRGPEDEAAAHAAWWRKDGLAWLDRLVP